MLKTLFGILAILHGLVHMWFVVLSQEWVEFQPDMGWTGRSWLFTNLIGDTATRQVASVVYTPITVTFVAGGIGVITGGDWWRPVLVSAAVASAVAILLFWDGTGGLIVQKGLIGILIDAAILAAVVLGWLGPNS